MKKSSFTQRILLLVTAITSLSACKTITKTGFESDKKLISIDISEHQLQYQYSTADVFKSPINEQLDAFDKSFIQQLRSNIYLSGYSYNMRGEKQTHALKECLIDFKPTPFEPYIYNKDTLYSRELTGTFVCTYSSDSIRLFYAKAQMPIELQIQPILTIQNKDSAFQKGWYFSENYAYKEIPLKPSQTEILANKLAQNASTKLDTLANQLYRRKYPERYHEIVQTQELTAVGEGFIKVVVVSLLVFLYLITPPID